jgi:hypothetical protein
MVLELEKKKAKTDASFLIVRRWNHLSADCLAGIHDDLLRAETGLGSVTACFQCMFSPSVLSFRSVSIPLLIPTIDV